MSDRLSEVLATIGPVDSEAMESARARQDQLTKPQGSLGRLEELAIRIAGIKGRIVPGFENRAIVTMAADHGVVCEGVALYPQEVTRQMVFNFLNGGAAINVLAGFIGARVVVVDMGVIGGFEPQRGLLCRTIDYGTKNMAKGPAMKRPV